MTYTSAEVLYVRVLSLMLAICVLIGCVGCSRTVNGSIHHEMILIDPGHGGFDGGAIAEDGTVEKHINLAIALCLRDLLYVCGASVEMTRQTDTGLEEDSSASIRDKKVSDMRRRLALYNQASMVISIHQNHFSVPKYNGTQVFYSANHAESMALAESIRAAVVNWVQPHNKRELKKATDGIYLLYHTQTPAVLVECGFLSNPEERDKLKLPAYQQQMAFAIMAGYWNAR